jgi:N-acyl-D-aspartate/D-glutamate deacylase
LGSGPEPHIPRSEKSSSKLAKPVTFFDGSPISQSWDRVSIGETTAHRELVSRSLADLAAAHRAHPLDELLSVVLEDPTLPSFQRR